MHTQLIDRTGLVAIQHQGRARIVCESGRVWLSIPGRDITLAAGERCEVGCDGLVLLEGEAGSRYSITTLPAARRWTWPFHSSPRLLVSQ
ncbi:hypothetical protein JCM19000A_03210 [Silvimonas sp. JCM 19000]